MSGFEDSSLPLGRGAVGGIAAWLFGYLVAYVWKSNAVAETLEGVGFISQLLGGEAVPTWKGVAWLFMNAHFVAAKAPTITGATQTVNLVTAEEGPTALLVLPPLVLILAGIAVAYGLTRSEDPIAGAKSGATLALGYLPLSIGAAFLTSHAIGDTDAAIAPDPVTAILLAGVVYPVVFGGLGGVVPSYLE
ncbi:transporter [Halorussus halophilus]|uniref:transporter n=1 Tax=Halorussus halophilus TaxID=2650975 RepID=UPI00130192C7|nr:transporter [Halorussus halophilus]